MASFPLYVCDDDNDEKLSFRSLRMLWALRWWWWLSL